MVKRGRSGGVSDRRFVNIVNESFEKGLKMEEIIKILSKERKWVLSSPHTLLLNVNKILRSRNFIEGEGNNAKKTKPYPSASLSNSSWSDAFDGSGNVSDDSGKFDLTNDTLRASYANSSKRIRVSDVELETQKNKVVGRSSNVRVRDDEAKKFKDLAGLKEILDDLTVCVIVPLMFPQLHERLGEKPISGILLYGPPGCGKSTLARATANETGVPFYMISASEIVSGVSGESEENIRNLFSKAYRTAPSIIFIDEIDAIGLNRDNQQKGMETRIVTQLMSCMDKEHMFLKEKETRDITSDHVIVIAATNRPEALDPALRRALRFDKEIYLGVPDEKARAEIFSLVTRYCPLEPGFDSARIVRKTSGFVGSDFKLLTMEAANVAVKKLLNSRSSELSTNVDSLLHHETDPFPAEVTEKLFYTTSDFEEALKHMKPSLAREGFSTIPSETWEDIGGLDHLREEFYRHVIKPIKHPEECMGFEFCSANGFLLYGPPGCGKTLVAKAVANEAGTKFIHVEGPSLMSKYVGETERMVRELFSRARTCAPCIIFFDEVDALTTNRGGEGAWVVERPLNQLLVELSGGQNRDGVIVIGATNRPEVLDPAVVRQGRFGVHLYVPLPNSAQRSLILKSLVRKFTIPLDTSVDLDAIARMERCENLSGDDLRALVAAAGIAARDSEKGLNRSVKMVHFDEAWTCFKPSLTKRQVREFDQKFSEFRGGK
ncbi:hypothetical protein AALP_AA1G217200 [Arabis alpina]|uniref:AAA+ ATPase domain-containing protein n=1 Tax=Arabis alpina TaxID=50452 RepID=A0A087HPQ9_ARAAL|nr:hypothetical protein AALP_AA1G217200 [Arabis alpina]